MRNRKKERLKRDQLLRQQLASAALKLFVEIAWPPTAIADAIGGPDYNVIIDAMMAEITAWNNRREQNKTARELEHFRVDKKRRDKRRAGGVSW
jgi:hypothetical protein